LQFTDARAPHLNFYLSWFFFFGGCFTLFKDTEVILPAIVTAGARALLVFATSAHAECFRFWHIASFRSVAEFGRPRSIADIDQAAPVKVDL
jgi:hypothetical protein